MRVTEENSSANLNQIFYRNQVNKVANAIQEIINGIKSSEETEEIISDESEPLEKKVPLASELKRRNVLRASLVYILTALAIWKGAGVIGLPENIKSGTYMLNARFNEMSTTTRIYIE